MAQLRVAPGGEHVLPKEPPQAGGFDFGLAARNARLAAAAGATASMPEPMSTGTTICGVVYAGGVVLGADTRATEGDTVADKNCEKIHYIADNIWCCGAGTSADTESTTALISSQVAAPFTLPTPRPPLHTQFSHPLAPSPARCASSHSSSCTG